MPQSQAVIGLVQQLNDKDPSLNTLKITRELFELAEVEALAKNTILEALILNYEDFDEDDLIEILTVVKNHPKLSRLSTDDNCESKEQIFALSAAGSDALIDLIRSKSPLSVLDLSNIDIEVNALTRILISLRQNFNITRFNLNYFGDEDSCIHVTKIIMAILNRNHLLQYYEEILANRTNPENLLLITTKIKHLLSSLTTCKLENQLTPLQDFLTHAPAELVVRFVTILKYCPAETVVDLLLQSQTENDILIRLIKICAAPVVYEEVIPFILELLEKDATFSLRLMNNEPTKELLFEVTEAIELIPNSNVSSGYEILIRLEYPPAIIKLAAIETGNPLGFISGDLQKLKLVLNTCLAKGAGSTFANFLPFHKLEELPDYPIEYDAAEYSPSSSDSFSKVSHLLKYGLPNQLPPSLASPHESKTAVVSISSSPYIAGLVDEKQAVAVLNNDVLRRGLPGYQVALLLARIKQVALIKSFLQKEKGRLPKAELLRAARANKTLAEVLVSVELPYLRLDRNEKIALQLSHELNTSEIILHCKEQITIGAYQALTSAEVEYLATAQPTLAMQLANLLLTQLENSQQDEANLVVYLSYLSHNKDIAETILNNLHFRKELDSQNYSAVSLATFIGIYHPTLIVERLESLNLQSLTSLLFFNEHLAGFALQRHDLAATLQPLLGQIGANFPNLGVFILKNQSLYQNLNESQIIAIGLNNDDCAEIILENYALWSKLSLVNQLCLLQDRQQLIIKAIHFNLIPYPFYQILNHSLSQFVLEYLDQADPDCIYELCLRDPLLAHKVFIISELAPNFIAQLSKAKLCKIACSNLAIADSFYQQQFMFDGFFNSQQVVQIFNSFSHWTLGIFLIEETPGQLVKAHSKEIIFLLCNSNELLATAILMNPAYNHSLQYLTLDNYVTICASHPKLALKIFNSLTMKDELASYLQLFDQPQRLKLKNSNPELAKLYPDYFKLEITLISAQSDSHQEEKDDTIRQLEPMVITPKFIYHYYSSKNSCAVNQAAIANLMKDRTHKVGDCVGYALDFLQSMMTKAADKCATYADVIFDLYQSTVEHADRISFYQERQMYYKSLADMQVTVFSGSVTQLTAAALSAAAKKILQLLHEKRYLLIETSEHALALAMHPKSDRIFLLDSNKKLWSFLSINQELLATLNNRIAAACFNTLAICIKVYHIPLHHLQLDPCLAILFRPQINRHPQLALQIAPSIENVLTDFKQEKRQLNLFLQSYREGLIHVKSSTREGSLIALEYFSTALDYMPTLNPSDHLWYARLAQIRIYRAFAYLNLNDLASARIEVDEEINHSLFTSPLPRPLSACLQTLARTIKQFSAFPLKLPSLPLDVEEEETEPPTYTPALTLVF